MKLCGTSAKSKQWRMETHHRIADDFDKVIMKDDSSSSVTEDDNTIKPFHSVRERLCHILEGYKFQLLVILLVIFDCLLVISELLIDIRILELQVETSYATKVVHSISLGILSAFLVEIVVKVFAFRIEFFQRKAEIFDAVVVLISFALDVAFHESHDAVNGTGLVIIFRLWRVVRILHGMVMTVQVQADRKVHRERCARQALEMELNKYRDYCALQEEEIEMLRGLLRKHGIEFLEVKQRPISGVQMNVVAEVNEEEYSDK
ncbi:Voltage-gated hydrogen channel 1 [Chamberlinius hualienensis]